LAHDVSAFRWNKVLVFNLGFDQPAHTDAHWIYYPNRARCFYRVGFYNNIFGSDRLSAYVEVGFPAHAQINESEWQARVMADLKAEGVVTTHGLVASHHVVLDPAYVHITKESTTEYQRLAPILRTHGVYPMGRYGGWTYCSIEDNIVEARALAQDLNTA
jgi:hypothetical protein